jgi:hypothetical protein
LIVREIGSDKGGQRWSIKIFVGKEVVEKVRDENTKEYWAKK